MRSTEQSPGRWVVQKRVKVECRFLVIQRGTSVTIHMTRVCVVVLWLLWARFCGTDDGLGGSPGSCSPGSGITSSVPASRPQQLPSPAPLSCSPPSPLLLPSRFGLNG
eukprot:GHVU01123834.1.p1 GENE.GHVU01123834.1~~GHVU01123834.1.p1  ORF type:complete len:108 (+),score=0.42 GHVU01123834.1:425-748(+)